MRTPETKADHEVAAEELDAYWKSLGLETALTGPTPAVRDGDWPCLAFTLSFGGQQFSYALGVGHIDKAKLKKIGERSWGYEDAAAWAMLKGERLEDRLLEARIACKAYNPAKNAPKVAQIVATLANDAQAIDESFEDWAGNFGYDTDSRKAEGIYRACVESFHKLRKAGLTRDQINKLADFGSRL